MRKKCLLSALAIVLVLTSCLDSNEEETAIVTEDIVYISSEVVRLTGRVLSLDPDGISDHGFWISQNEDFNDPVVVSLGFKKVPGRFFGETKVLNRLTGYYCRSFATTSNGTVLGNIKAFETLLPAIKGYYPKTALPGKELVIDGKNFTQDTKVFFGDTPAEINEINFEAQIKLTIPPIDDHFMSLITVQSQDQVMHFPDSFEYIFGKWEFIGDFVDNINLSETLNHKHGNKFYFGLGRDIFTSFNNRLWSLDLTTWNWQELDYSGLPVASSFSSSGFFGTGQYDLFPGPIYILTNDWWHLQDNDLIYKGTVPFYLYKSRAITIDNSMYVIGGYNFEKGQNKISYKYDMNEESWSIDGEIPFHIDSDLPHFMFEQEAYFVTTDHVIWKYNVLNQTWTEVGETPFVDRFGGVFGRGISEVVNGKVYFGIFRRTQSIWEYDIVNNSWKSKVDFVGNVVDHTTASFVHDDIIYVIRSKDRSNGQNLNTPMEIWSFDPAGLK